MNDSCTLVLTLGKKHLLGTQQLFINNPIKKQTLRLKQYTIWNQTTNMSFKLSFSNINSSSHINDTDPQNSFFTILANPPINGNTFSGGVDIPFYMNDDLSLSFRVQAFGIVIPDSPGDPFLYTQNFDDNLIINLYFEYQDN